MSDGPAYIASLTGLVAACTAAYATIVNARAIKDVKREVVTGNGNTIGAITQSNNARRIGETVQPADQTDNERHQVAEQAAQEAAEQAVPRTP